MSCLGFFCAGVMPGLIVIGTTIRNISVSNLQIFNTANSDGSVFVEIR